MLLPSRAPIPTKPITPPVAGSFPMPERTRMSTTEQPLLTVQDVAVLLATSERTIYRRVQDGTLPARKIGGTVRFHRSDLAALLDA